MKLITLITAARLNGDADGTYRSVVSQHLRGIGQKFGRERMVGFAEVMLLRVVTEIGSGNLNLKQAAARALALAPYIQAVASGEIGGKEREVFAVEFWGRVNGGEKRAGYICDGPEDLAECIQKMAVHGWPNMRVLNLNRMMRETMVGWRVATEGAEKTKALLGVGQDGSDPGRKSDEFIIRMIDEVERRLKGKRRSEAPANDDWQWWKPPTSVAA